MIDIRKGCCLDLMATLPESSVDSIVTDPPYHLTAVSRGGSHRSNTPDNPYGRHHTGGEASRGFMGKTWDGGDIAFRVETWTAALRVLKPGGHLLAFSGTRTYHRMVCAIEDAGFEIRDQIGWVYGSGFPKSRNGEWGGTALKPAWEPIVVARKPLVGTVEQNWRAHGTGALNIDACRIPGENPSIARRAGSTNHLDGQRAGSAAEHEQAGRMVSRTTPERYQQDRPGEALGRWPANIIHDGSDEVLAAFPEAPGQLAALRVDGTAARNAVYGALRYVTTTPAPRLDSGSAARFFYCAKASRADRDDGLSELEDRPVGMVSNTSGQHLTRREEGREEGREAPVGKNAHPTVKPTTLMRYLCRLVTPPGGTVLDPFTGSGSTGRGAVLEGFGFIGFELDAENGGMDEVARRRVAAAQALRDAELTEAAQLAAMPQQEGLFA